MMDSLTSRRRPFFFSRIACSLMLLGVFVLVWPISLVAAENGASDERVSLPEGPGSLGGIGENAQVNESMGQMSWGLSVKTPSGHSGATPSVSINYSSGMGQSVVGMGWALSLPYIERMTRFGLPEYTDKDRFAVNGGDELVKVSEDASPMYRARFEGGFVRYFWESSGAGDEGWWRAEFPDGSVASYGATLEGASIDSARFEGSQGTFRYHLVERRDVHGNALRYDYSLHGENKDVPLLDRIGYGYSSVNPPQDADPRFEVAFVYEERQDRVSDGSSGTLEVLDQRLSKVFVRSDGVPTRRYELLYEDYSASGGFSRLDSIQQYGRDGGLFGMTYNFSYSQVLGSNCDVGACTQPYLQEFGELPGGVSLSSGLTTLIDMNGDSLPDVLYTPAEGPHRFFLNQRDTDGIHSFGTAQDSALGTETEGKQLGAQAQALDVDGDGFCDLLLRKQGTFLRNTGTGDWSEELAIADSENFDDVVPEFEADFDLEDNSFSTIRFVDLNNDKRIDLLQTPDPNTSVAYLNNGEFGFYQEILPPIGASFASSRLDTADMNGDGLMDLVEKAPDLFRYRLHLGSGVYEPWVEVSDAPFTGIADVDSADLQDLNGDGLDDLILVKGTELEFALNDGNGGFLSLVSVTEASAGDGSETTSLPNYDPTTWSLQYADMNGNGSTDVIWIDNDGGMTSLDLFPLRPNLLTRIDNGIGNVIDVQYGTSIDEETADASSAFGAWAHPMPTATQVVRQIDTWDRATNIHRVQDLQYHSAYYSPGEKAFRGFESVESFVAVENSEPSKSLTVYDQGAPVGDASEDVYRQGEITKTTIFGGWKAGPQGDLRPAPAEESVSWRELITTEYAYKDCNLTDVPGNLSPPIRFRCLEEVSTIEKEGGEQEEWVTMSKSYEKDGYGGTTKVIDHGIVQIGGGACAPCDGNQNPCGDTCSGDEKIQEVEFIAPLSETGGLWKLGVVRRIVDRVELDGLPTNEQWLLYDGEPFVGLEDGTLTKGLMSRSMVRVSNEPDDFTVRTRQRHNQWGRVMESLDPRVSLEDPNYRTTSEFDAQGIRVLASEIFLEDENGPYSLRNEYEYDDHFGTLAYSTPAMLMRDGEPGNPVEASRYTYDEFGRLSSIAKSGADAESPTEAYTYEYGTEESGWFTKVTTRSRTLRDGPFDQETYHCKDSSGGVVETRMQTGAGELEVTSRALRNGSQQIARLYRNVTGASGECANYSPNDAIVNYFYDALGRKVRTEFADGDESGSPSEDRTQYKPRKLMAWDSEDLDPESPFFDTPNSTVLDGRGHFNRADRYVDAGETVTEWFAFDDSGSLLKHVDPAGHVRTQEFDMQGQAVSSTDMSRGTTTVEYNNAGSPIRQVDGNGDAWRTEYDGVGRIVSSWEEGNKGKTQSVYSYDTVEDCPSEYCTNLEGRLSRVVIPLEEGETLTHWYGYDDRGLLSWGGQVIRGVLLETNYSYDDAGNTMAISYPGDLEVAFGRDAAGRVVSVDGLIDGLTYDSSGLLESMLHTNGVLTEWSYNSREFSTSLVTTSPTGEAILALTMLRDRLGRLTDVQDNNSIGGRGHSARYEYDCVGRLVEAHLHPDIPEFEETLQYAYNQDGVLSSVVSSGAESSRNLGDFVYEEVSPYALSRVGDIDYQYDAAGQVTKRGNMDLVWDSAGRLQSILKDGVEIERNSYSTGTKRVRRQTSKHQTWYLDGYEIEDGVVSVPVVLGSYNVGKLESISLMAELLSDAAVDDQEPDGIITAGDAWANLMGLDSQNTDIYVDAPELLLSASARANLLGAGVNRMFMHQDHRGNVAAVTGVDAELIENHVFYPFGTSQTEKNIGEGEGRFAGKETSDQTDLVYFGSRHLDPYSGRWVSPDRHYTFMEPSQLAALGDATDPYGYVVNDPINQIDPSGENPVLMAIGGVVGFGAGGAVELWSQNKVQQKRESRMTFLRNRGHLAFDSELAELAKLEAQVGRDSVDIAAAAAIGAASGALTMGIAIPGMVLGKMAGTYVRCAFQNPDTWYAKVAGAVTSVAVSGVLTAGIAPLAEFINGSELGRAVIDTGVEYGKKAGEVAMKTIKIPVDTIVAASTKLASKMLSYGIKKVRAKLARAKAKKALNLAKVKQAKPKVKMNAGALPKAARATN